MEFNKGPGENNISIEEKLRNNNDRMRRIESDKNTAKVKNLIDAAYEEVLNTSGVRQNASDRKEVSSQSIKEAKGLRRKNQVKWGPY